VEQQEAIPERVPGSVLRRALRSWPVLVVGALLVPLWAFPFFPSQDGPSHVANAWILLRLLSGRGGEWASVYEVNFEAFPNWFTHAGLAALLALFEAATAERLFLTAYVLTLLGSFRYATVSLRPESAPLFVLVVPFVYDSSLHLGFYNRAFAAVPSLLAIGLWVRRGGRLGVPGTASLGVLFLWLYFCTAVGLLVTLGTVALLLGSLALDERRRNVPDRTRALARRVLALAAASIPSLALLVRFGSRQAGGVAGPGPGWLERLRVAATLDPLVSLDPRERWLSMALAAVLAAAFLLALAARIRRFEWRWPDGLLVALAVFSIAYFAAPAMRVGGHGPWGGTLHDRIAPHLPILLLLWLAAQPLGRREGRLLGVSAVAIGLGLLGLRLPRYAELNEHLREYASLAPFLPRGATLLPLGFAHQGRGEDGRVLSYRTWPFRHAADRLVVSRGVQNVDNYEADVSFFPVTHRPGHDPYRLLGSSLDRLPACVRLDRFNEKAPRPADFLLLWRAPWAERSDPCAAELLGLVETRYERVTVSKPRGQAELFRRRAR
jgi:hypothetical protein